MKWLFMLLCAATIAAAQDQPINLSDTTPAPPSGNQNCRWQKDGNHPANVSCYTPVPASGNPGYGICANLGIGTSPLSSASTPGMIPFGPENYWSTDVSASPVDPNSDAIITYINASTVKGSQTAALSITATQVTGNVATLTGTAGYVPMSAGRMVTIAGLSGASWLNGQSLRVASVLSTGITVNVTHANYALTSDSGTATTTDAVSYLHPDFGQMFGIPYSVVDGGTTPPASFNVEFYPDESDIPSAVPFPAYLPVEGLPEDCVLSEENDQHAIIVDRNQCWLYEMWKAQHCHGVWTAGSSTVWDLTNLNQRPLSWTSVDAAGLSVFAGLVRYDEVATGSMHHALRATFDVTNHSYVAPATHFAALDVTYPANGLSPIPMGMRLRLKAGYDISGYSSINQVILRALKKYGLINADNGHNMYLTGAVDGRWNDADLHQLQNLTAHDFEVIQTPAWYTVLSHGYQIHLSGLTNASYLNGQTVTICQAAGSTNNPSASIFPGCASNNNLWSSFTAQFSHADYTTQADTGTATLAALPSGMGTLANAPLVMPIVSTSMSGGILTVQLAANSGSNIPTGTAPTINGFTATPATIAAGQGSVLRWDVSDATYNYLTQSPASSTPEAGMVRTLDQAVHPTTTTTYTLVSTNQFGRVTRSVTVTVQ